MRKYRKVQAIMLGAALAASYAAPAWAQEAETEKQTQAADANEAAMRIVSMGPNMTEIVFALGKGDELVGITDYCNYPAQVSEIESVGSIYNADIEKILSLEPDIVLASTHFSEEALEKLNEAGVNVLYLYSEESMEGVFDIISQVGEALSCEDEALEVISTMQAKLEYVSEHLSEAEENPSAYYVVGYGEYGDYTAGKDTFINDILEAAGAENIAADVEGWAYSTEKLLENDPYYVITNVYCIDDFSTMDPYTTLTAVKEERVCCIDTDMLDRQGPRNADAVVELAFLFHPECFESSTEYPLTVANGENEFMFDECPETVYAASEELFELLVELGVIEEGTEYEEKSAEDISFGEYDVVIVDETYSEEDLEDLKDEVCIVIADPESDDTILLLGQIFDRNAKADEICYVREAIK